MIFIHQYQLKRKKIPNSKVKDQFQKGCLIKVIDMDNNYGVADICPWPNFGDLPIDLELKNKGPLFQRALELAKVDLEARKNQIKLVDVESIKNHQLIIDFENFDFENFQIREPVNQMIKIKGSEKIEELGAILNKISKQYPTIQYRLDFNYCLNEEEYRNFLKLLDHETISKIKVVEDPFQFNEAAWSELDEIIPIALDWNLLNIKWKNLICKPTRQLLDHFLYMTSAMDHPIGVAHGIAIAQKFPEKIHGFLTNDMYEDSGFLNSVGSGVGYEEQIKKLEWIPYMNWNQATENQLLFNLKLPRLEKKIIFEMATEFSNKISNLNYFLIPSSGSSQKVGESVKLVALTTQSILNSAERINKQFQLTKSMNWGCVLPTYHVGGLGILARSFLSGSNVFFKEWNKLQTKIFSTWLEVNNIQVLSLVPAQVYDLVIAQIEAPECVKIIFVGGSVLENNLWEKAKKLGWPIIQTYGMTETASMIAFKSEPSSEFYQLLDQVQIIDKNINCNSLASYSIQKKESEIVISKFFNAIPLLDRIEIRDTQLRFLGRINDQIQILSETVSMSEVRSLFEKILFENQRHIDHYAITTVKDSRSENRIICVFEFKDIDLIRKYNLVSRPFERITGYAIIQKIPKTDLGKIKYFELKSLLNNSRIKKLKN